MHIAGGIYLERCKEGEWNQLYGSGLRAAAALQEVGSTHLSGFVGPQEYDLATVVASTFGVKLDATIAAQTIRFEYDHGLSVPLIFPPLDTVEPASSISVSSDQVLRFGMVDGDAIVRGKRVVYDPQSAYRPTLFADNGSTAERLTVVCNRREAYLLTGEKDAEAAGKKLLLLEQAEAIVVKCGSYGALLVTAKGVERIPAYRTERVWPIGSGDVFAAVYFAQWAVDGRDPSDAALTASNATAHYCQTKSLPLPDLDKDLPNYSPLDLRVLKPTERRPRVYLAGPFFNMSQRWLVEESREALIDQKLDVFSPFHDVGFGLASEVVPADIAAIHDCDVMLALLDHMDSGTLFEVGYARCMDKPVIGFCQGTAAEPLKMLIGTSCEVVDDFVSAIYRTAWAAYRP